MSRIAKKLYLASKITENIRNSVIQNESEEPHRSAASSVASLIRPQNQALPCDQTDPEDILSWGWDKIVERFKDGKTDGEEEKNRENFQTTEDEEKEWLERLEKIETSIFNGVKIPRSPGKKPIEEDFFSFLDPAARRIGKNRTVLIAGCNIGKESLECKEDEAVPTMAGKDPSLAGRKREKRPTFRHQKVCT